MEIHRDLEHPRIIRQLGSLKSNHSIHTLLELAPKGSLFAHVHPWKGIPESLALRYVFQIGQAVKYLHDKGIVHRDIKPENILLDSFFDAKLSDFGWACRISEIRRGESPGGTLEYLSPEALKGEPHGPEADVWALGILLYELLHGAPPYNAQDLETMRGQSESRLIGVSWSVSPDARDLLEKILQKDPKKRPKIDQVLAHPVLASKTKDFDAHARFEETSVLQTNRRLREGETPVSSCTEFGLKVSSARTPDAALASSRNQPSFSCNLDAKNQSEPNRHSTQDNFYILNTNLNLTPQPSPLAESSSGLSVYERKLQARMLQLKIINDALNRSSRRV